MAIIVLSSFPLFLFLHTIHKGVKSMIDWNLLKDLLLIASVNSAICLAFIQKIKKHLSCSKCIPYYSFAINMLLAIVFCISFTDILFPKSLWIGFFSYIGADTLYKTLEGKLAKYSDLVPKEEDTTSEELEEIHYE